MEHLSEQARIIVGKDNDSRIQYMKQSRWISYARAENILSKMENLLKHPKVDRMPNLLLAGDTNNGKSMLAKRFWKKHPPYEVTDAAGFGLCIPVFYVQMPHAPNEGEFYDAVLRRLKANHRANQRTSAKKDEMLNLLYLYKVEMLVLDEVQHVLAGGLNKQRNFLNLLKWLCNELKIPMIAIGTRESFHVVAADPQMANRFDPNLLPRWGMNEDYLRLLASFEYIIPLKKVSGLLQPELAGKIMSMSEGIMGEISTILTQAFEIAVENGDERITERMLSQLDWVPPSQRVRKGV